MALTFQELRTANGTRSEKWHGDTSWSLSDWGIAMMGEGGEACNVVKKLNRIRDGIVGNKGLSKEKLMEKLSEELADTAIYLDLLALHAGVDLEAAIVEKFNRVSVENGFPERL